MERWLHSQKSHDVGCKIWDTKCHASLRRGDDRHIPARWLWRDFRLRYEGHQGRFSFLNWFSCHLIIFILIELIASHYITRSDRWNLLVCNVLKYTVPSHVLVIIAPWWIKCLQLGSVIQAWWIWNGQHLIGLDHQVFRVVEWRY